MTKLTRWEMETTINFNMDEKTAVLYTRDRTVMRKLDKLVEEFPDTYKCIAETDLDKTYEFPKKLLSYRKPKVYTEEQIEVIRERFARIRAEKEAKGEAVSDEELEEELEDDTDEDTDEAVSDDDIDDDTDDDTDEAAGIYSI